MKGTLYALFPSRERYFESFFFWFPHHFEQGQSRAVIPCYLEHSPRVFISVTSCPERSEVWLRKLFAGNVVIYGKTYSFYTLALPAV